VNKTACGFAVIKISATFPILYAEMRDRPLLNGLDLLNFAGPANFAAFAGLASNNEYAGFSDSAGPISFEGGPVRNIVSASRKGYFM
jgi:hypothetical protein